MSRRLQLCPAVLVIFVLGHSLLPSVFGVFVNITVDDQGSDSTTGEIINYEGDWALGPNCLNSTSICRAAPDPNQALDGTWHDTSYNPSVQSQIILRNATFDFTGTAIYVFGMVDGSYGIDLLFILDGEEFHYADTPTTEFDYKYHQLYFQAEGLNNTSHYWKLQNGLGGGTVSVVLFDYLVYTKDDNTETPTSLLPTTTASSTASVAPSSSSTISSISPLITFETPAKRGLSRTTRTIVIIIPIVGGIAALTLLVLLYRVRRRRQERRGAISDIDHVPGNASVTSPGPPSGQFQHTFPSTDAHSLPLLDVPPTYYNSHYAAAAPDVQQEAPRTSQKARYTPVTVASPSSSAGWQQRDRGRAGGIEEDAVTNDVGTFGSRGSIAGETAPPMYQSEVGHGL